MELDGGDALRSCILCALKTTSHEKEFSMASNSSCGKMAEQAKAGSAPEDGKSSCEEL